MSRKNTAFSRIISLLRKEQGFSQKQAAADLGISQALLSHYEKGIRECGLAFVVRVADYYDVSTDYLLGRTAEKSGAVIKTEDIPDKDDSIKDNRFKGSLLPTLNKKLISNSIDIIFDLLQQCNHKSLTIESSSYLSIAVYSVFRQIYSANRKNPEDLFSVEGYLFSSKVHGEMAQTLARIGEISKGVKIDNKQGLPAEEAPALSPDIISKNYPLFATSLFNLMKNTETKLK